MFTTNFAEKIMILDGDIFFYSILVIISPAKLTKLGKIYT